MAGSIPKLLKNPLFRLLAINFTIGAVVATMVVAGLILSDTQGIGTLVRNTQSPAIAVALLFGGFLITFSSVAMGWAIMRIGAPEDDSGKGGGKPVPAAVLAPVPVRSRRH
ncbi:MAG: hypothetical protein KDJ55_01380 [Rhodobiaceae bacterium]|nr:hypothetical protein [Rhodobiaceae bacterium]MCC0060301.1 hypothetical protein [Rhodobiaceae bacterium]